MDDSRSMAETGCGTVALEALTLLCRAMARLEVRAACKGSGQRGGGATLLPAWFLGLAVLCALAHLLMHTAPSCPHPARQVGELGVVSFGGGGGAVPLHPLERPFTDADGVRIMSQVRVPLAGCTQAGLAAALIDGLQQARAACEPPLSPCRRHPTSAATLPPSLSPPPQMRFDQDNTIADRPMMDVVTSLDHMLDGASARAGASAAGTSLHQLVLVVADGRWVCA